MWRTSEPTANPKMALELVYGADFIYIFFLFKHLLKPFLAMIVLYVAILARAVFGAFDFLKESTLHLVLRLRFLDFDGIVGS